MVIPSLPPEIEAALAEIVRSGAGGGDYAILIRRAVFAFRDELLKPTSLIDVRIPLGKDIEALAVAASFGPPRMWVQDPHLHVEFTCTGDYPSAAEVDAMERIAEAVVDARDLFRAAYRQANP